MKRQNEEIDREGLRRIQDMIKGVVKPVVPPPKTYQMPKGDTVTVAKMKAEIAAKKASETGHIHNPEVVNESRPNTQPEVVDKSSIHNLIHNQEVVQKVEERGIEDVKVYLKDIDLGLIKVLDNQLSKEQQVDTLLKLQQRCQAEGVSMPTGADLIESLLVLQADSL